MFGYSRARLGSLVVRMTVVAAVVAGISLSFAGATAAQARSDAKAVSYGLVLKSAFAWPTFVALHKNMFERQGLAVQIILTGSSAGTAQQLLVGAIDIGELGLVDAIRAINYDAPLKIVASEIGRPPYSLISGKEYKSLTDLKGKLIIVGGASDVTRYFAQVMLASAGLKGPDYDFVFSGSSTNRLAAVANGSVAAAVLGQPFDFNATAQGFNNLGSAYKFVPEFEFDGYAVARDWASKNSATLVKLLKAQIEGTRWLYDPANKAEAIAMLVEETGSSREDATKTYDLYFDEIHPYPRDGWISRPGFERVLEALAGLGDLPRPLPPFETFVDLSFVDAAVN